MYYLLDLSRRRILISNPSLEEIESRACEEAQAPKEELIAALATLGAIIATDVPLYGMPKSGIATKQQQ